MHLINKGKIGRLAIAKNLTVIINSAWKKIKIPLLIYPTRRPAKI